MTKYIAIMFALLFSGSCYTNCKHSENYDKMEATFLAAQDRIRLLKYERELLEDRIQDLEAKVSSKQIGSFPLPDHQGTKALAKMIRDDGTRTANWEGRRYTYTARLLAPEPTFDGSNVDRYEGHVSARLSMARIPKGESAETDQVVRWHVAIATGRVVTYRLMRDEENGSALNVHHDRSVHNHHRVCDLERCPELNVWQTNHNEAIAAAVEALDLEVLER